MTDGNNNRPTARLFGIGIDAVTMDEVVSIADGTIGRRSRLMIGVVNVAKVVNMRRDPALRDAVLRADMIFADGMGVVWACRLLGRPLPERIPGIDLMLRLLERSSERSYRVYCLGATEEVLEKTVERIRREYPGVVIAGRHNGYFSEKEEAGLVADIRAAQPDLLFAAMSSPKKELFLARWAKQLDVPVCHGVGGAFDVFAGEVKRAPARWQRLGMEWLYRVLQEPRRMWRRYLVTNTVFAGMLLGELVLGADRSRRAQAAGSSVAGSTGGMRQAAASRNAAVQYRKGTILPARTGQAAKMSSEQVLAVIIPAYNEQETIHRLLKRVDALKCVREIIVVDDGSTDATASIVASFESPRLRLIRQGRNRGKTAAVARGVQEVESEIVIIQDADLEYDPSEIPFVIAPILSGEADVVYGSRFLVRRATRVLYFYHYLANKGLTFLCNLLTNRNMTDIETCYKAFRTPIVKWMPISSSGFGMEVEITALVSKTRARSYEVPISYYGRTYEEGKKIGAWDGLLALWYIFYYNLIAPHTPSRRGYILSINKWLTGVLAPDERLCGVEVAEPKGQCVG